MPSRRVHAPFVPPWGGEVCNLPAEHSSRNHSVVGLKEDGPRTEQGGYGLLFQFFYFVQFRQALLKNLSNFLKLVIILNGKKQVFAVFFFYS